MKKPHARRITKRKISRPSYWMPREADIVDYHSIIGGAVTSRGHTVLSVGELQSGEPVAWITDKSGCVSVDALSPSPELEHQVDGDPDVAELVENLMAAAAVELAENLVAAAEAEHQVDKDPDGAELEHQVDRCRVCGCTDLSACDGGCFWVEPGLCSQCSPAELEHQVDGDPDGAGAGAELGGCRPGRQGSGRRRRGTWIIGGPKKIHRCPKCGSEEIEGDSPRTTYSCGSSDYDQRPGTFRQSICCCLVQQKEDHHEA